MRSSLSLHTGLDLAELGFASKKLLSLLVDLALHLELDLTQLLFLSSELLLLEADGLGGKVLGLLGTVVLVQEVVGDFLQISQVAVEQRRSNSEKIGVTRVVDLDDTPGVVTSADLAATNLDNILRSNNGERHETTELGVLLDGIFVVLLDVVGEVVDRDAVVLDILHDQLL
ncbi:hypothetical protein HG530_009659 [Fusarium avenaceum]|nr:hypothetical protein HG530_009659 [Fusarium avenaceum]